MVVYLVNHEYTDTDAAAQHGVAPSRAATDRRHRGRASVQHHPIVTAPGSAPGRRRAFVPLIDGTDRVGVLELEVPVGETG